MENNDRKLLGALFLSLTVIAAEFLWYLIVGPASTMHLSACSVTKPCDPWWDSAGFWTATFTLTLTASTMLLWWQTKRSADAARDGLADAKEYTKAEFRAYIRIEIVGGEVRKNKPISFNCKVINYGRTPANDFAMRHNVVIRPPGWMWEHEADYFEVDEPTPSLTIHPHAPQPGCMESDFPLTDHAYEAVKKGEAVIYARGIADYSDVLGDKHRTYISIEFSGEECVRTESARFSRTGNFAT